MSLYPPGCSGPPDYPEDCQVCGVANLDHCVCPECPECGEHGNPHCYTDHGMIRSQKQVDMFKARMDAEDAAAKAEAEWLAKNEQGIQDYYAELEKELKNELY
jgi:hypothetical protein